MKSFFLDKGPVVRRWTLLVLVAGVPAIFHRSFNDPFNVPKLSLLITGVAIVAACRAVEILQGAPWDAFKRVWFPAAVIAIPLLISWGASSYKGWALFGYYGRFQGLIPYIVFIAFGVLVADAFAGETRPLAWGVVVGGALMGAYALLQWLGADPFEWAIGGGAAEKVALSTTGNPNFTGGYLGTVVPVAAALVVLDAPRRWWAVGALVLVLGGWYVADSQGGWAAGVLGAAVTGGFLLAPRVKFARVAAWSLAALGLVAVVFAVVLAVSDPDNGYTSPQVTWRGWWWQAAINMAEDSPVWGHGPNTFAFRGPEFRVPDEAAELNYNMADDPHSVFFSFLANTGGLGALGLILLIAWVVRTGVRAPPEPGMFVAVWVGALVAYFVQAVVSIDELSLRLALWTGVGGLAACLAPRVATPTPRTSRRPRRRRSEPVKALPAVAAVGVALLVTLWWSTRFLGADAAVATGGQLFGQGEPEQARQEFESALSFRGDPAYRQTFGFQLGQVALALQDQGREYLDDTREEFRYLDDYPDVNGLATYARILHAWAAYEPQLNEAALDVYERGMAIDSLNPLLKVEATDVLNAMGRHEEAIALLGTTVETGEYTSEFWGALALARVGLGDEEGARGAIEIAFKINPEDSRAKRAEEELEKS